MGISFEVRIRDGPRLQAGVTEQERGATKRLSRGCASILPRIRGELSFVPEAIRMRFDRSCCQ